MTRRRKKQRTWEMMRRFGWRHFVREPGTRRRQGGKILPDRNLYTEAEYRRSVAAPLVEPLVRTPVGKRRERRGQGKPR